MSYTSEDVQRAIDSQQWGDAPLEIIEMLEELAERLRAEEKAE